MGKWAFTGVAVTSLGGPLALVVIGALAAGQVILAAVVGGLTVANVATPVRYAVGRGRRAVPAWLLAAACVAFALYGVWTAIHTSQS